MSAGFVRAVQFGEPDLSNVRETRLGKVESLHTCCTRMAKPRVHELWSGDLPLSPQAPEKHTQSVATDPLPRDETENPSSDLE